MPRPASARPYPATHVSHVESGNQPAVHDQDLAEVVGRDETHVEGHDQIGHEKRACVVQGVVNDRRAAWKGGRG